MRAHAHHEAAVLGHVVGDDRGWGLIHVRSAVLGRDVGIGQAHFSGLLKQLARHRPVLVLHLLGIGQDLVGGKLLREFGDHLMIFVKVFRSEDVFQVVIFEQKTSARGLGLGNCRYRRSHRILPCQKSCSPQRHKGTENVVSHKWIQELDVRTWLLAHILFPTCVFLFLSVFLCASVSLWCISYCKYSKMPAAPMPPPTHMVTMP